MDILLPQIIFQIVNFSVVLGALVYLLYKPVLKVLNERSKRIQEAQKAAEETLAERDKLAKLEKSTKEKADKKAAEIVEKARESAKKTEQDLLKKAQQKAAAEVEKHRAQWEDEKRQHLSDMRREFVDAVVATAQKVVGESLTAKKHKKVIDAGLADLLKKL